MGEITKIGWTDKTHNEWIGCQQVTEAECGDCYALRWAKRHGMDVWGSLYGSERHLTRTHDNPRRWNREAQAQGRRYKVFCASLSDVFEPHPQVAEARKRLWALIEETPYLDWQLLTKRPKFIRPLVPQSWLQHWPGNTWIGTSVGIQGAAGQRIPYLLEIPAPVRFLSCEPLVEPVTLTPWLAHLQWVICGGYSGREDRPMRLAWARSLREECRAYQVAFFMKQLGSVYAREHGLRHPKGEDIAEFPEDLQIQEFPLVQAKERNHAEISTE
jgi:protein gp37